METLLEFSFLLLTEETRKDIVKSVKEMGEDAKISIRNARRDQNEVVKKAEKAKEISEDDVKNFKTKFKK
jgi:ribosome recycling factor